MKKIKFLSVTLTALFLYFSFTGLYVSKKQFEGGKYPAWEFTSLDSLDTLTSSHYDITPFDGGTVTVVAYFNGGTNDSVKVLVLGQCYGSILNNLVLDTIYLKSQTLYTLSFSPNFATPKVALQMIPYNFLGNAWGAAATVDIFVYSKTEDSFSDNRIYNTR